MKVKGPGITGSLPEGEIAVDGSAESTKERFEALKSSALESDAVLASFNETTERIRSRVQTLRALRKARGLTQSQMAETLGVSQAEVSRMERRENVTLNTLSRFIEATGGRMRITVAFENAEEVEVSVGDLFDQDRDVELA